MKPETRDEIAINVFIVVAFLLAAWHLGQWHLDRVRACEAQGGAYVRTTFGFVCAPTIQLN